MLVLAPTMEGENTFLDLEATQKATAAARYRRGTPHGLETALALDGSSDYFYHQQQQRQRSLV